MKERRSNFGLPLWLAGSSGASQGKGVHKRWHWAVHLTSSHLIVSLDLETAKVYGEIEKGGLRKRHKEIDRKIIEYSNQSWHKRTYTGDKKLKWSSLNWSDVVLLFLIEGKKSRRVREGTWNTLPREDIWREKKHMQRNWIWSLATLSSAVFCMISCLVGTVYTLQKREAHGINFSAVFLSNIQSSVTFITIIREGVLSETLHCCASVLVCLGRKRNWTCPSLDRESGT